MKVIAQLKALLCRVTGAGCVLHTLTQIAPAVLGLLMGVILLLTAPAAMAQTAYVEGEVIVGFRSTANDIQIAAFESRNGLTKLKSFPHIRAANYRIAPGQTTDEAIAILSKEPIVEYAEPNWILKRQQSVPNDPKFPEQWYLSNTGQVVNGLAGTPGIDINWLAANNLFSGSQDIVVAVIDTGVAFDHPEFVGKLWVNPDETLDGIDNDGNGYIDDIFGWDFYDNDNLALDENSHGTLVASLIAASSGNGEGGVGVSSRVKVMPLRAGNDLGSFTTTAIIEAFTYAGNKGAKIINASFGGPYYSSPTYSIIQWLGSKGVLVVAAAGNGGSDRKGVNNDITPLYPASYALDNIISVAAIDQEGRLATFSNYGPLSVHIAAPGTNIFGASPTFSTVFYDSFETGGTGWTQGQLPGSLSPYIWSIYEDGFGRHWLTDSINFLGVPTNYTGYTNSFAQTPLISVGFVQLLSYRIWCQLEYRYDWLLVEASSDGGATWTLIDRVTGFYSSCPNCSIYAGSINYVDLSHYGLQNKNIYIRFRLISNSSLNYDGVYLDEITIKQVVPFSYNGTQYQYGNGTSFSAPLVAGVAALIWSQRPDFTYKQVRNAILNSAKSLPDLQGMISTGGMVDAYASLQSAIAASPSAAVWTDMWWNPSESGWGVNIADQAGVLFIILYLYGQDGNPRWYSAGVFQTSINSSGYPIYQGDLYFTTGPWFDDPFNPQAVNRQKVGSLTFSPSTPYSAQLSYSVNGVNVSKQIQRFTFNHIPLTGYYLGGLVTRFNNCGFGPPPGFEENVQLDIHDTVNQDGVSGQMTIDIYENGNYSCRALGTYQQYGSLYEVNTITACNSGGLGLLSFRDFSRSDAGIEGNITSLGPANCTSGFSFSAVCSYYASAAVWTDMWWNPSESGWGVNIADQDGVLFIILYLYGQDGNPRWYSAGVFQTSINSSGYPIYQGDLYFTTGPWFDAPFNPQAVNRQKVGSLTFSPSTPYSAQLSYSVNGVNVSKQIQRFTFNHIPLTGYYLGGLVTRFNNCGFGPPPGFEENVQLDIYDTVNQDGVSGQMTIDFYENGNYSCRALGTYQQYGSLYEVNTITACNNGGLGLLSFRDFSRSDEGIEGNITSLGPANCTAGFSFSAVNNMYK